MKYWIQSANFSAADREATGPDQLIAIFESHDWGHELQSRGELERANAEWCDPGLGVVPEDGRILHLCPHDDGSVSCHYEFVRRRRMFGFIPSEAPVTKDWLVDSRAQAREVLRRFLAEDHDWLSEQRG